MKENNFYKISKNSKDHIASLRYGDRSFDFEFSRRTTTRIRQIGLAIIATLTDGTHSLLFPISFKGVNAEENMMFALMLHMDSYQYSNGLLIAIDNDECSFINIDSFEIQFSRIMTLYLDSNFLNVPKDYLRNLLVHFTMTTIKFTGSKPYIKGKFCYNGSYILNMDNMDFHLSPYNSFPSYELLPLGKTEYITSSLIKVTNPDGKEYMASNDLKVELYDQILPIDKEYVYKMLMINPLHDELYGNYSGYKFIKDGKVVKIGICHEKGDFEDNFQIHDDIYMLSFDELEAVDITTLRLKNQAKFMNCHVEIWEIDTEIGKKLTIIKHNDEQKIVTSN